MEAIKISDLCKAYGNIKAVNNISISVNRGEVFWLLGADGAGYTFLEQSFGAITTIAICAGGVMGLPLVVSDYRHKKILKRFKVTPISPAMILEVQVVIYALYSIVSLMLVYATATIFFMLRFSSSWLHFLKVSYFNKKSIITCY